jgi:hypothetical protein
MKYNKARFYTGKRNNKHTIKDKIVEAIPVVLFGAALMAAVVLAVNAYDKEGDIREKNIKKHLDENPRIVEYFDVEFPEIENEIEIKKEREY